VAVFISAYGGKTTKPAPLIKYIWMREREMEGETIQNIKNYFQFLVNVLLCGEFVNDTNVNAL
jgi:hypothetical protein